MSNRFAALTAGQTSSPKSGAAKKKAKKAGQAGAPQPATTKLTATSSASAPLPIIPTPQYLFAAPATAPAQAAQQPPLAAPDTTSPARRQRTKQLSSKKSALIDEFEGMSLQVGQLPQTSGVWIDDAPVQLRAPSRTSLPIVRDSPCITCYLKFEGDGLRCRAAQSHALCGNCAELLINNSLGQRTDHEFACDPKVLCPLCGEPFPLSALVAAMSTRSETRTKLVAIETLVMAERRLILPVLALPMKEETAQETHHRASRIAAAVLRHLGFRREAEKSSELPFAACFVCLAEFKSRGTDHISSCFCACGCWRSSTGLKTRCESRQSALEFLQEPENAEFLEYAAQWLQPCENFQCQILTERFEGCPNMWCSVCHTPWTWR